LGAGAAPSSDKGSAASASRLESREIPMVRPLLPRHMLSWARGGVKHLPGSARRLFRKSLYGGSVVRLFPDETGR
ncbi:hypothetical protein, partial [Acinetobacter baumannii]|uniref:hypothetical protein n=1 Tax=Acinetobacter baumannii TaxID=470 RepID=UPI001C085583